MAQVPQLTRPTPLDAERRSVISDNGKLFAASREAGDSSTIEELVTDRFASAAALMESDNIRAVEADGVDLAADNQRLKGSFEVFDLG